MGGPEWVPIIPGRGQIREVAIELLSLADDPSHVRTTSNGSEFAVLPYVAERFTRPAPAPNRRTRKKGDG
ncbi:MAG TPA: hypothetical protein VLG91_07740 [Streptomyces sp.]|nr:hypothetical protein [Streptomyces sp.]